MDLNEKIRTLPTQPGVYLYKNAEGEVIYVGKAKNLRSRVRSYFLEANQLANRKTGSLMREAVDLEYILVANEREALALENNLIKQRKPRFNILLRDDKTYPYVKLTVRDRHPEAEEGRRALLRPILSRQPGLPSRGPHPPQLPDPLLQGGSLALSPATLPGVLHQALPCALRRKPRHTGRLPRRHPRRAAVPGRQRERTRSPYHCAHARSRRQRAVRTCRAPSRPDHRPPRLLLRRPPRTPRRRRNGIARDR